MGDKIREMIKFDGNFNNDVFYKSVDTITDHSPAKLVRTGSSELSQNALYQRSKYNYCLFNDANLEINEK